MSIFHRFYGFKPVTVSFTTCWLRNLNLKNTKQINSLSQLNYTTDAVNSKLKKSNLENTENLDRWTVIYQLPVVRLASAFQKLKIYQGGISIAGTPATFMLEQSAVLPSGSGITFAAVGLTGLLTLALSSLVIQNLIGFIYISGDKLKFSLVDYWGSRKDIIMDIEDLIPDGAKEKPTRSNLYQIISTKNNEKFKMKLLQRYGVIMNQNVFHTLFY